MILESRYVVERKSERKRRILGAKAGAYLESIGYEILEYNFRCRMGEIDIIARDGEYLVFCEVKYRAGTGKGYPSEAVDKRKQRVISKCALYYLTKKGTMELPCRFDVVTILNGKLQVIKNAFDYAGA